MGSWSRRSQVNKQTVDLICRILTSYSSLGRANSDGVGPPNLQVCGSRSGPKLEKRHHSRWRAMAGSTASNATTTRAQGISIVAVQCADVVEKYNDSATHKTAMIDLWTDDETTSRRGTRRHGWSQRNSWTLSSSSRGGINQAWPRHQAPRWLPRVGPPRFCSAHQLSPLA